MTSQEYQMNLFEESEVWMLSVEDFRARLSALQETDEVLKIHEELCSLKLQGSHLFSDLNIYSLKTSKDCSTTTEELHSRPFSEPWTNWGYNVEWQVLNSKNFGVPQNRERVFIVGHLRGQSTRRIFPLSSIGRQADELREQSTNTLTTRYPNSQGIGSYVIEGQPKKVGNVNPSRKGMNGNVYSVKDLSPTLTTNKGEGVKIIQRCHGYNRGGEHEIAPTLTSNNYHENNMVKVVDFYNRTTKDKVGTLTASGGGSSVRAGSFGVYDGYRIRKLTPRECWRLQGFPDWAFDKAQEVNSNSQLYKQAGNSVTVNVIAAIAKELG